MNIGDLFLALRGDGTLLQQDVTKAGDKAGQTFGQRFGKQLGQSATRLAASGGAAVGAFVAGSTQAFAQFDDQMREVFSIMPGISQAAMDKMKDDVLGVSKEYGILTDDLVPALQTAIGSGIPEKNVMSFLQTAAKTAKAGATDAETSVKVLAATLNAFHLPVESANDVADKFFNAVDKGVTTFPELADSMSQVAPQAAAMGIGLEDVLGAVTAMTLQGEPTSSAVTKIAASMTALQRTTPAMDQALKNLGFTTGQAAIDALGYQGTLEALRAEADRSGVQLIDLTGRLEGTGAILQLTGENAGKAQEILGTFGDTTGKVDAAFETMEGGIGGATRKIVANLKAIAIEAGDSLQIIGPLFVAFGPQVGRLLGGAIGAGAGVAIRFAAPALAKLAGSVMEKLGIELGGAGASKAVAGAIEGLPTGPAGKAATAAGTKLGGLMGAGMTAGIIAVGAAAIYEAQKSQVETVEKKVMEEFDKFTKDLSDEKLKDLQKNLQEAVASPLGQVQTGISGLFGQKGIQAELDAVNAAVAARAAKMPGAVATPLVSGAGQVTDAAATMVDGIPGAVDDVKREAIVAAGEIPGGVAEGIKSKRDLVTNAFDTLKDALKNSLSPAKEMARTIGFLTSKELADGLKDKDPYVRARAQELKEVAENRLVELRQAGGTIGKKAGEELAKGLKSKNGTIRAEAQNIKTIVTTPLQNLSQNAGQWGVNVGTSFVNGVVKSIRAGKGRFNEALSDSTAALHGKSPPKEGPLMHIDTWGENIMNAWAGGMLSAAGEVRRSASTLAAAALPHVSPLGVGAMALRASPSVPGALGASSVAHGGDTYNIQTHVDGLVRARDPLEVSGQLRRLADLGVLAPKKPRYT